MQNLSKTADSAQASPSPILLVRFKFGSFKHLLYLIPRQSKPSPWFCNPCFSIHHFHFGSLQLNLFREFQPFSKQDKHWNSLREVQGSSNSHQASIKVPTLPYSNPAKAGIFSNSISLNRQPQATICEGKM